MNGGRIYSQTDTYIAGDIGNSILALIKSGYRFKFRIYNIYLWCFILISSQINNIYILFDIFTGNLKASASELKNIYEKKGHCTELLK